MSTNICSCLITFALAVICSACFGQEEVHYPGKVELVHATKTEVHVFQLYEDRGICKFPTSDGTDVKFLTGMSHSLLKLLMVSDHETG